MNVLTEAQWKRLANKFKTLTIETWNGLDGMKKINLLKLAKIEVDNIPTFGYFEKNDIYLSELTKTFVLDLSTLNKLRNLAIYEPNERGGTIEYSDSGPKLKFLFSGNSNRINLDLNRDTHTLFHTHPIDQDRETDPPSVLDILSYLALIVKYIADIIIDMKNGIEHSIDDPLIVQNRMVFTHNEIYVYYISKLLVESITNMLMNIFLYEDDFNSSVELLLDKMELSYSNYLYSFNRDLNIIDMQEYLQTLEKLGILVKRYNYFDKVEVAIIE